MLTSESPRAPSRVEEAGVGGCGGGASYAVQYGMSLLAARDRDLQPRRRPEWYARQAEVQARKEAGLQKHAAAAHKMVAGKEVREQSRSRAQEAAALWEANQQCGAALAANSMLVSPVQVRMRTVLCAWYGWNGCGSV